MIPASILLHQCHWRDVQELVSASVRAVKLARTADQGMRNTFTTLSECPQGLGHSPPGSLRRSRRMCACKPDACTSALADLAFPAGHSVDAASGTRDTRVGTSFVFFDTGFGEIPPGHYDRDHYWYVSLSNNTFDRCLAATVRVTGASDSADVWGEFAGYQDPIYLEPQTWMALKVSESLVPGPCRIVVEWFAVERIPPTPQQAMAMLHNAKNIDVLRIQPSAIGLSDLQVGEFLKDVPPPTSAKICRDMIASAARKLIKSARPVTQFTSEERR